MSEINDNEIIKTEKSNAGVFDPDSSSQIPHDPNSASKGLTNASGICVTFMWICIILAIVGALIYFAHTGKSSSRHQAYCAIGSACFLYGIIGSLSNFIFSKILIGLSVITKASEKYLSENE